MANDGYAWCPGCRKWVPAELMNYDYDDENNLVRICTPCLEGTSDQNNYVYDEHHEETECIYCGGWKSKPIKDKKYWYECPECGETFRRF